MAYIVYKSRVQAYACVHRAACGQVRKGRVTRAPRRGSGRWSAALPTFADAIGEAVRPDPITRTAGWEVRHCRYCRPDRPHG